MKPAGRFKLVSRNRAFDAYLDPALRATRRVERILDSLRAELTGNRGAHELRIRKIFENPREIYRLELELPELGYQRTTLLDRDALEELLAWDEVRDLFRRDPLQPHG